MAWVCRCPGRVNLIGEHIDYSGYGVLPMALELHATVVATRKEGKGNLLEIEHVESSLFPSISVEASTTMKITPNTVNADLNWSNYVLCGVLGVLEHVSFQGLLSAHLLVSGNVPKGAGLSSSSALVCASALATSKIVESLGYPSLSMEELAVISTKSERYIGTMGGGMDQSISFLATEGTAKFIEFDPLRATSIPIPPGVTFVVANSMTTSSKALQVSPFNVRVVECRLAATLLAHSKGALWSSVKHLGQAAKLIGNPKEAAEYSQATLPEKFTLSVVAKHLGLESVDPLIDHVLNDRRNAFPQDFLQSHEFQLRDRAVHVYSEAARVEEFRNVCLQPSSDSLKTLGSLMDQSHASCRDLYSCSAEEVDALVQVAKNAGAFGSRLTGAGWGGCTVSLIASEAKEQFLESVWEQFYSVRGVDKALRPQLLFASQPGGGASVSSA